MIEDITDWIAHATILIGFVVLIGLLIMLLVALFGGWSGREQSLKLHDGRTVICVSDERGLTCDWEHAK